MDKGAQSVTLAVNAVKLRLWAAIACAVVAVVLVFASLILASGQITANGYTCESTSNISSSTVPDENAGACLAAHADRDQEVDIIRLGAAVLAAGAISLGLSYRRKARAIR